MIWEEFPEVRRLALRTRHTQTTAKPITTKIPRHIPATLAPWREDFPVEVELVGRSVIDGKNISVVVGGTRPERVDVGFPAKDEKERLVRVLPEFEPPSCDITDVSPVSLPTPDEPPLPAPAIDVSPVPPLLTIDVPPLPLPPPSGSGGSAKLTVLFWTIR